MFLLFCLSAEERINATGFRQYKNYSAGYYSVTVVGAQGSHACLNGEVVNKTRGGHGAIITGILHLKYDSAFEIFVGKSHSINCSYNPENIDENSWINSGFHGHNACNNYTFGGIGGEYTLITNGTSGFNPFLGFVFANKKSIVGAGGGSGATIHTNGASAGGNNYTYKINQYGEEEICNEGCLDKYASRGQSNMNRCDLIPGSGGGGGADELNGLGGNATNESSIYLSAGKGGASYYNEEFFIRTPSIFVGINNSAYGDGYIDIEPIQECSANPSPACLGDCSQTSFPTYEYSNLEHRICRACPANCTSCLNETVCTNCTSGHILSDGKCVSPVKDQLDQKFFIKPNDDPNKKKKLSAGVIAGIVVGILVVVVAVVAAGIFFVLRAKKEEESTSQENEEVPETAMIAGSGILTTLENPVFSTTTLMQENTDDIFANEFEEGIIERNFLRH